MDKETKRRWGFFVKEGLEQKRIIRKPLGSWLHFWIFWGFVFLFFGTCLAVLDWDIGELVFGKQFLAGMFTTSISSFSILPVSSA